MFTNLRKQAGGKGFTLIELLVVIAIIGVLASIVLASLNSARRKSRDARRIADVKQIQLALELYFDSNNGYPDDTASLATQYIPAVPADPLGGVYSYCVASGSTSYHIGAGLEEDTNPALDNDRDAGETGDVICSSGEFNGTRETNDTDAACSSTDANRNCYDLTP